MVGCLRARAPPGPHQIVISFCKLCRPDGEAGRKHTLLSYRQIRLQIESLISAPIFSTATDQKSEKLAINHDRQAEHTGQQELRILSVRENPVKIREHD